MRRQLRSFKSVMESGIRINKKMSETYPKEDRKPVGECSMMLRGLYRLADSVESCIGMIRDDIRIIRKPKRNKFVTRKYL